MVEAVTAQKPPQFTTIIYETKDGEKVSATKKDGIVTLVGDKNGVRQMELDKFIKEELANNVKNLKLENSLAKDTVEISKPAPAQDIKPQPPVVKAEEPAKDTKPAQEAKPEEKPAAEPKKLNVVA